MRFAAAMLLSLVALDGFGQLYVTNEWSTQTPTNIGCKSDAEYKSGWSFTRDYNWLISLRNDITGPRESTSVDTAYGYVQVGNGIVEYMPGSQLPAGCYRSNAKAIAQRDGQSHEQTAGTAAYCIEDNTPPKRTELVECTHFDNCGESPIVLNLGVRNYRFSDVADGVRFDLNADGTPERTAWTIADSAVVFLALDRNGNSRVDDGSELFGDATPLGGTTAPNGFEALAQYDANDDRAITAADEVWSSLVLWRDANHNGRSEAGELSNLAGSGITALMLDYHWTGRHDASGNALRYQATFEIADARKPYYDVFFRVAN